MSESDGIDEAFEGQLRVALTVAGRTAEELARWREQAIRDAEARSLRATRDLQERLATERTMAVAALAPLEQGRWWERASPQEVAAAWQTARAWQDVEPAARRAADTIREQVRSRFGVDVDDLHPDPQALTSALAARDGAQRAGDEAAAQPQQARQEEAVALLLATTPDRVEAGRDTSPQLLDDQDQHREQARDARAETSAERGLSAAEDATAARESRVSASAAREAGYDSPQRRAGLAQHLSSNVAEPDAVQARLLIDQANAHPATAAVVPQTTSRNTQRADRGLAGRPRAKDQAIGR